MQLHPIRSKDKTVFVPKPEHSIQKDLFSKILNRKAKRLVSTGTSVKSGNNATVTLGAINKDTPTVSHLLVKHPQFKKNCWRIIHAKINQNKAFNKIKPGETIFIDPATKEITWGKQHVPNPSQVAGKSNQLLDKPNEILSTQLSDAVKSYIGTSYNKVDCYELVVNGIKSLGYQYYGQEGIQKSLMEMAVNDKLPVNAYLTGEGLTEKTGKIMASRSYKKIDNPARISRKFINEIKPLIKEGRILSFSTLTKGHTGVISKQKNKWTFINSGLMDNSVKKTVNTNEVGEEFLTDEIKNWFALAKKHKEPLKITIGSLDKKKLEMFM